MFKKILTAAVIGAAAMGAHASSNLLTDGDFESTGLSFGSGYCYAGNVSGAPLCGSAPYLVNGWTGVDTVYLASDSGPWGNPGAQSHSGIDLGNVVVGIQGQNSLVSAFSFTPGDTYTLSWTDAGRNNYGGNQTYGVTAGGVFINDFDTFGNGWQAHSVTFTATAADALVFQGRSNVDSTSFIDNVSVSVVSEPAANLMLILGVVSLLAWRRRPRA